MHILNTNSRVEKLYISCGKLYYEVGIVRLNLSLVSGFVAHGFSAPFAAVNDYITALGVGLRLYGAQNSAALVCSVTRIYVNVQRAKAEWAVVA